MCRIRTLLTLRKIALRGVLTFLKLLIGIEHILLICGVKIIHILLVLCLGIVLILTMCSISRALTLRTIALGGILAVLQSLLSVKHIIAV